MLSSYILFEQSHSKRKFTVQLHHADRAGDHYDIRLEKDNVMVSFATRKLDQLVDDKVKKILIFKTEDHSMSWYKWSGKLKSGYGKGTVEVWDSGTYEELKWTDKSIIVKFDGKKLDETYSIIPYNVNKRQESYLMFKSKKH